MTETNMVVLVEEKRGNTLDSVTAAIEDTGVRVSNVLRGMKTIVATASDDELVEKVRHLDGVASVRVERTFSLPRMDPSIPQ